MENISPYHELQLRMRGQGNGRALEVGPPEQTPCRSFPVGDYASQDCRSGIYGRFSQSGTHRVEACKRAGQQIRKDACADSGGLVKERGDAIRLALPRCTNLFLWPTVYTYFRLSKRNMLRGENQKICKRLAIVYLFVGINLLPFPCVRLTPY